MESKKIKVEVFYSRENENNFGVLVDLHLNENGRVVGGSRLEWFPKSICELERIDIEGMLPRFFLTAPEWLLKRNKVRFKKQMLEAADLEKFGKVVKCEGTNENFEIIITDGYSPNARNTIDLLEVIIKSIGNVFGKVSKCVTQDNYCHIILKK